jgi:hypothetical protein
MFGRIGSRKKSCEVLAAEFGPEFLNPTQNLIADRSNGLHALACGVI